MSVYGFQCKMYYNSATYGTPTWVEMTELEDVLLSKNYEKLAVNPRSMNGTAASKTGLRNLAITGKVLYVPANTIVQMLEDRFDARTVLDVMILKGDDAVDTVTGYRMDVEIFQLDETQGSGELVYLQFEMVPTPSANTIKAVTVTDSAPVFTAI